MSQQLSIKQNNQTFFSAGETVFDALQDEFALWAARHTVLFWASCQPEPPDQFCRAAVQTLLLQFRFVPTVNLTQMIKPAAGHFQFCAVDDCQVLQDTNIPLQASCPSRVNSISQFGIISKLGNDAFNSCTQMTDKYFKYNWP